MNTVFLETLTDLDIFKVKKIYLDDATAENYSIEEHALITENNDQIKEVLLALDAGSLRETQLYYQLKGEIVKVYRKGIEGTLCSKETIKETKIKILNAYEKLLPLGQGEGE